MANPIPSWQEELQGLANQTSPQSPTPSTPTSAGGSNAPQADWMQELQQLASQTGSDIEYPHPAESLSDQISAMPNSDKLSGFEKFLYRKLPGFSESTVGKALETFAKSPAGKVLGYLDFAAEGLERTLGLAVQYRDLQPGEEFKLKDAWAAGTLFYDVSKMPRIQRDEAGNITGIRIDSDMPGSYAVTEARKLLEQGKTIEEVRDLLYGNMGALALRAQLQDTLGHIAGDPLTWALGAVKPIERLHAIRNLAVAGKMDTGYVQGLIRGAELAGDTETAATLTKALESAQDTGKAMTRLDRFAIAMTGGTPWLEDVSQLSKAQQTIRRLNPFKLTPQAQASELLDIVAANVAEYLITPNLKADPEVFLAQLSAAARGSIGNEWGHLAMTLQGRTVQGILSNSDAVAKKLGLEWKTYEVERGLIQRLTAIVPGTDERKLWNMIKSNPQGFWKKITDAAQKPGGEALAAEIQVGRLTQKHIDDLGKIPEDIPLFKEEFYTKALVSIQDVATQQSILQFGIKEKGLLTKWSDALKAWETIPFIKANPANMVRNIVNNDVTLIGRGLFGTMSARAIDDFWKGKFMPPQLRRAFAFAGEGEFDAGVATQRLIKSLEGSGDSLPQKVKAAAEKINLGKLDFSKESQKWEARASIRASTVGWLEFHRKYWNPKTGFTSVTKALPTSVIDEMEELSPGITRILDEVAEASGADAEKFGKLMQSNIEHNVATIFKNTEDTLGYKLDDVLGTETLAAIQEGLPAAIEKGNVREFISGVRQQMEAHVDEMFNQHIENLPGIVAAQVQAGGQLQYHRIFGKALDEFWGGNTEHAMRMSTINELMDTAKSAGDWKKVDALWNKILSDSEAHFGRVWKKFDAYQAGMQEGAKKAGIKYPAEVSSSFKDMRTGWEDFFKFRNEEYQKFFAANLEGKQYSKGLQQIQGEITSMYDKMIAKEDELFQRVDDLMARSLPDKTMREIYTNYRDQAAELRKADRTFTKEFYQKLRTAEPGTEQNMWSQYWAERGARLERIRQLDIQGSAAIQGDSKAMNLFAGQQPGAIAEPKTVFELAQNYGIPSATKAGARNNRRILNTVNKYLPEGTPKFKNVDEIPMEVAQQAFDARAAETVSSAGAAAEKAFIPDAEKLFPDPMPIETAISELNYGRGYAAIDNLIENASAQTSKKSALIKDLPEHLQKQVDNWARSVNDEMSGFRSAGVQYASFRRDSALLNYNRRTNFDNFVGHIAPFAFWTTHSAFNWAIMSLDRPAMVTSYFRARKLFETAGLKDQNVPTRLKGHIRIENMPFAPEWMGDMYTNPMRFLLPFDAWMTPWEQRQSGKLGNERKTIDTLDKMLEQGDITDDEYNEAVNSKSGDVWERAFAQVQEGGDSYDAMDFVNMTMTPHAPLMWAYNAARGQKNEIGAFTPMSRTVKNVATMMGVDDWSNSPYNVEGKIRKQMGLPAYDKWDDYRVGRQISNLAADGTYDIEKIREAMQVAALVESGKMSSKDAVAQNAVYAEATKRASQEYAGGWAGTVLGIFGIPLKSFPTGEERQRELADKFTTAIQARDAGDPEALTKFFDENPEYESRLALFKSPDERLKAFMVDNIWARWNDLPKVNQDEMREQLGENFAQNFLDKETRNLDALSPTQLQVYLKLMGGKPVGTLTADQEVLLELNQITLTDPETAWRVQSFYEMRNELHKNWFKLQSDYYKLPENGNARQKFLMQNPELKEYWDARRDWMSTNPDLARFLTDDEKQLKKFERMQRTAESVPNAEEIRASLSQPTQELIAEWAGGQSLPPSIENYLAQMARERGLTTRQMLGILTGR